MAHKIRLGHNHKDMVRQECLPTYLLLWQCHCCSLQFFSWLLIKVASISLKKACRTPEEKSHKELHWHSHILWLFNNRRQNYISPYRIWFFRKKFIPAKEPTEKYKHHFKSQWRTKLSNTQISGPFPWSGFHPWWYFEQRWSISFLLLLPTLTTHKYY